MYHSKTSYSEMKTRTSQCLLEIIRLVRQTRPSGRMLVQWKRSFRGRYPSRSGATLDYPIGLYETSHPLRKTVEGSSKEKCSPTGCPNRRSQTSRADCRR